MISRKRPIKVLQKRGTLIIIGGAEDKKGEMRILKEVAQRAGDGKILIITAASEVPQLAWKDYLRAFKSLGYKKLEHLHINQPEETHSLDLKKIFAEVSVVFFSGGDQLKLTSKIGGTKVMDKIVSVFRRGGTIAGTSAGAAIMGETMLVGQEKSESHKIGNWMMAPGMGFVQNVIIDQHFAQRRRIGRLLRAVALHPGIMGIGIDEGTAIIIEKGFFRILGDNAVYILDGSRITYTNISEDSPEKTLSVHDVKLHVLSDSEIFDIRRRKPLTHEQYVAQSTVPSDMPSDIESLKSP